MYIKKINERHEETFYQRGYTDDKHMKRCSTSLFIRKI